MRMRPAVLFLWLLAFVLTTSSATPQTSFTSDELQERDLEKRGLMQNMRTGHSGGDGGYGGGQGGGNGQSSTSTTQPGRPLNGAGTTYSRNHPHHGAGVYSSTCSFSMLITSIVLTMELFVSM